MYEYYTDVTLGEIQVQIQFKSSWKGNNEIEHGNPLSNSTREITLMMSLDSA